MYLKLVLLSFKQNIIQNIFVILQMTIVFSILIVIVSAIKSKTDDYTLVKDLIDNEGYVCSGYFLKEPGVTFASTDEIKEKLKGVNDIHTINFGPLLGDYKALGNVSGFHPLIYDDYLLNLYKPVLSSGKWLNEIEENADMPCAVITDNPYGITTGDIITADTMSGMKSVLIVGVIADGEKFISLNTRNQSKTPYYNIMTYNHFNSYNDQLKNEGYSNEEIVREVIAMGYESNDIIYNQPYILFCDTSYDLLDEQCIMSTLLFIEYNEDITKQEKLFNQKFLLQELNLLSFAVSNSDMNDNSIAVIKKELYSLLPIAIAGFMLVILGSVSINAINFRKRLCDFSVLYICGSRKIRFVIYNILYNTILTVLSICTTAIALIIISNTKLFSETVITFGIIHLIVLIAAIFIFLIIMGIIPLIMLKTFSPKENLSIDK